MWSWAAENVSQDFREQEKLLFSLMDNLTWWLQPQIRKEMDKNKTEQWPVASGYFDELRNMGASEEYIRKEMDAIQQESEGRDGTSTDTEDSDDDQIIILRGPNGPK